MLKGSLAILGFSLLSPAPSLQSAQSFGPREILDKYCVTCHNQKLKTGGLIIDPIDIGDIPKQAETWEKVVRKLRARLMPPPGLPRPTEATYNELTSWLESNLDSAARRNPYAGRPLLHRLNR